MYRAVYKQMTILLVIQLIFLAAFCFADPIVSQPDTAINVPAGTGAMAYQFNLGGEEYIRIDFVNPDKDFSFTLGNISDSSPFDSYPAPRTTGLKFFTLQVSDNEALTSGIVMRWRYPSISVDPLSTEFLIVRGSRWWEFDQYSELNAESNIIAQSLPNTELMQGVNYIGVKGGNAVALEDEGDPRFEVFGEVYQTATGVTNKYIYKLDRKQIFQLEFIDPNYSFNFTVERTTSNPGSDMQENIRGMYYFHVTLDSDVLPGPEGLRYGAMLTFKYPNGVPENIVESSLNFLNYDGTQWNTFSSDSERSVYSQFVSQPTSALLEFSSLEMNIAIAAESTVVAEESEKPQETGNNNNNEETTKQEDSNEQEQPEESHNNQASANTSNEPQISDDVSGSVTTMVSTALVAIITLSVALLL